jgi:hypothetical protein
MITVCGGEVRPVPFSLEEIVISTNHLKTLQCLQEPKIKTKYFEGLPILEENQNLKKVEEDRHEQRWNK